jgi:hypothetical protein
MNETTTIGLDIAKQVFQLHGVAVDSTVTVKRQLRRSDVIRFFDRLPRCRVGLEACGGETDQRIPAVARRALEMLADQVEALARRIATLEGARLRLPSGAPVSAS